MIKVSINKSDKVVNNIIINGHANFDEYGKDIVCASVSSIVITSINAILRIDEKAINYQEKEGLVIIKLNIQLFAHKKGQGSTKNGRDSESKRLGAKAADGEYVTGGSILYRQRGTKIYPGHNVGIGKDDTVYAKVAGYVKFERLGRDKKQVSIYPEKVA